MSDYCTNTLSIFADTEEGYKQLEELKKKCTSSPDEPFTFNPAFPIPEDIIDVDNNGWAWDNWRYKNWSTLEPNYVNIISWSERHCYIKFDTPYHPPINWMIKVSRDYPELHFLDLYNDIDKISVVEGQNGVFFDQGRYVKDLVDVTSNNLKDYSIGTVLQPINAEGNPYRFTIEVTGPESAIVEFERIENRKYWDRNINYALVHELQVETIEKRTADKGDVKITFESTGDGGYYFTLCYASEFQGSTVSEIVKQSLSFMKEIEGPVNEALENYEVSLEEGLRKELNLVSLDDGNHASVILAEEKGKQFEGTGTREWADATLNCNTGCKHNCLYCNAKTSSVRCGKSTPDSWKDETVPQKDLDKKIKKYDGLVMFPSSHDIHPDHLQENIEFIGHILEAGNEVLIGTKPHLECIKEICKRFRDYRDKILFRFTIGSADDETLKFWEPRAPGFAERLLSLKHAFVSGFRTSISCEPMLDDKIDVVIRQVSPYVTETIWIGKMNGFIGKTGMGRLEFNGHDDPSVLARAEELIAWQSDENILKLYSRYERNSQIRWKDSIQKVINKYNK